MSLATCGDHGWRSICRQRSMYVAAEGLRIPYVWAASMLWWQYPSTHSSTYVSWRETWDEHHIINATWTTRDIVITCGR